MLDVGCLLYSLNPYQRLWLSAYINTPWLRIFADKDLPYKLAIDPDRLIRAGVMTDTVKDFRTSDNKAPLEDFVTVSCKPKGGGQMELHPMVLSNTMEEGLKYQAGCLRSVYCIHAGALALHSCMHSMKHAGLQIHY